MPAAGTKRKRGQAHAASSAPAQTSASQPEVTAASSRVTRNVARHVRNNDDAEAGAAALNLAAGTSRRPTTRNGKLPSVRRSQNGPQSSANDPEANIAGNASAGPRRSARVSSNGTALSIAEAVTSRRESAQTVSAQAARVNGNARTTRRSARRVSPKPVHVSEGCASDGADDPLPASEQSTGQARPQADAVSPIDRDVETTSDHDVGPTGPTRPDGGAWYGHSRSLDDAAATATLLLESLEGYRPGSKAAKKLWREWPRLSRQLHSQVDKGAVPGDLTNQIDTLVKSTAAWMVNHEKYLRGVDRSSKGEVRDFVQESIGCFVPQITIALHCVLCVSGSHRALDEAQIQLAGPLAGLVCKMYKLAFDLRDVAGMNIHALESDGKSIAVVKKAQAIHARIRPFAAVLHQKVSEGRQRAERQDRLAARQAADREQRRLAALRGPYEAEVNDHRRAWLGLHDIRRRAALTPGGYINARMAKHLADLPLPTVPMSAANEQRRRRNLLRYVARHDKRREWRSSALQERTYRSSHDELDEPLEPRPALQSWTSWSIAEESALFDALLQAAELDLDQIWSRVIWNLCVGSIDPSTGRLTPRPLSAYNVSEIVDQGVYLVRAAEKEAIQQGFSVWETLAKIVDPRIPPLSPEDRDMLQKEAEAYANRDRRKGKTAVRDQELFVRQDEDEDEDEGEDEDMLSDEDHLSLPDVHRSGASATNVAKLSRQNLSTPGRTLDGVAGGTISTGDAAANDLVGTQVQPVNVADDDASSSEVSSSSEDDEGGGDGEDQEDEAV